MRHHLNPLLRRTWIPLTIAVAVIGGVVLALPWYYKTFRGAEPERGLQPAEIEWARAYAPWREHVHETLTRAHEQRNTVDGELGETLDAIAGCDDQLWTDIGTPPSERLDPVAQRATAACGMAGAALAEYREAGDTPSWRTSAALAGALNAMQSAEMSLRKLLLAQKPLERRGGADETRSRVEPRLSAALSATQPTELLCWSEDDWPQVQAELAAVGLEESPPLRRDVNAYRYRVHASPAVCGALARFAYADDPQADTELALALLAVLHAAEHATLRARDEQQAECNAVLVVEGAARRLGAGEGAAAEAARLARAGSGCPEGA